MTGVLLACNNAALRPYYNYNQAVEEERQGRRTTALQDSHGSLNAMNISSSVAVKSYTDSSAPRMQQSKSVHTMRD